MNFRGEDYQRFRASIQREIDSDSEWWQRYQQGVDAKVAKELSLVERGASACPVYREAIDVSKKLRSNLEAIQSQELRDTMGANFYNFNVMEAAACAIDSMFYYIPGEQGSLTLHEIIRQRITKMKVMAAGVQGEVSDVEYDGVSDFMVIKTPKKPDDPDMTHELFVGVHGTNKLRRDIPNFAFIYGGFRCPPPDIDPETKEVINVCSDYADNPTSVPYLLMEKIFPAVSATKYIGTASIEQMLSLYFQFLFAVDFAHRTIDFTHYDAHTENLLMRDISASGFGTEFYIPYPQRNGKTIFVKADRVATLIDFGMAGIRHEGKYHGIPEAMDVLGARFNDRSWPMHDAYKMLCFLIQRANEAENREVVDALTKIFKFFNTTDNPIDIVQYEGLKSQWKSRFAIPPLPRFKDFNLRSLILFVIDNFKEYPVLSSSPPSGSKILQCTSCLTFKSVARISGAYRGIKPETFIHLYDVATLKDVVTPEQYQEIVDRFDYPVAETAFFQEMDGFVEKSEELKRKFHRVMLQPELVFDERWMAEIHRTYAYIYRAINVLENFELYLKVGRWVAELYNNQFLRDKLLEYEGKIEGLGPFMCEMIENANENYEIIYEALQSEEWKKKYSYDRRFSWYKTNVGDIVRLRKNLCARRYRPENLDQPEMSLAMPSSPRAYLSRPSPGLVDTPSDIE